MDELQALVEYVSPQRLRQLSFFQRKTRGKRSKAQELYELLHKMKGISDQEACRSQCLGAKRIDSRYYKLKYELRHQL
ncbi:MAG: hypothetical protein HC821_02780, partial [Lewinella sp.]|nr:hypothetical protein [Lewinella sp.]